MEGQDLKSSFIRLESKHFFVALIKVKGELFIHPSRAKLMTRL